jgi:RHS repeat-associated protein
VTNGVPTTYTLDLAAGLVQVLVQQDTTGATRYLYGVTRIGEQQPSGWAYHLGDALGSVRQLADDSAQVTLARGYMPYGELLWSVGDGSSAYGYTGEDWNTVTQLVFLRARYYSAAAARFTQQDPSGQEQNLYAYAASNPVNRVDPSGLFSLKSIAKSYGYSNPDDKEGFLQYFASQGSWPRWGWLAALLMANDNDTVRVGVPLSWPPFLDETQDESIRCAEDGLVRVGSQDLQQYASGTLEKPWLSPFYRNTRPINYHLGGSRWSGDVMDHDRPIDLPDFRIANIDIAPALLAVLGIVPLSICGKIATGGVSAVVDRYGHVYGGVFLGAQGSCFGYISGGEGYVNRNFITREGLRFSSSGINWTQAEIPNETEIAETITGPCANASGQVLGGINGSVCWNGAASAYAFLTPGAGFAIYGSFMLDLNYRRPDLAWDYIDRDPGETRADVERLLEGNTLQCDKCGQ